MDRAERVEPHRGQRARDVLRAHAVRRHHDPVHGHAPALLEAPDAPRRLGGHGQRAPVGPRPQQLPLDVVVAVHDQRHAVAPPGEELGGAAMRAAGVERDHRHRRVVAVRIGVRDEALVVDEAVAPPAQVRVVEHERGAQRRRRGREVPGDGPE
jgi:hypothetical protein